MKKNTKTLNEILDDYQSIEMKIIENDGEIDNLIEDSLEINKSELEDKLDGYEGFVKYLEGQISYLKEMEAHYLKRRRVLEKSTKRCKDSMVRALSLTDLNKVKTLNYNFSLCESESWDADINHINDNEKDMLIKDGFAENVFKLSMSSIKSHYKNSPNADIPEWIKVSKNSYIRVS